MKTKKLDEPVIVYDPWLVFGKDELDLFEFFENDEDQQKIAEAQTLVLEAMRILLDRDLIRYR